MNIAQFAFDVTRFLFVRQWGGAARPQSRILPIKLLHSDLDGALEPQLICSDTTATAGRIKVFFRHPPPHWS